MKKLLRGDGEIPSLTDTAAVSLLYITSLSTVMSRTWITEIRNIPFVSNYKRDPTYFYATNSGFLDPYCMPQNHLISN